jgi:hypothetical protein
VCSVRYQKKAPQGKTAIEGREDEYGRLISFL